MKNNYLKFISTLSLILLITWTISCSGRSGKNTLKNDVPDPLPGEESAIELITITFPDENSELRLVIRLKLFCRRKREIIPVYSVLVFFDGIQAASLKNAPWESSVSSSLTCG